MEWRGVLEALEDKLADLDAHGVTHLNIAADPDLTALLRSPARLAAAPQRAVKPSAPSTAPPGREASPPLEPGPAVAPGREPLSPPEPGPVGVPPPPGEIQTIESLLFQYRNCMNCKLGAERTKLVFGAGESVRPRLMFIGEGPGAEEDRQGLPFVGRAGKLLTGFIEALGLTRDDVYITNVVKCRPPGNRNPEMDEIAACRSLLQRQIELLDPTLIVVLGNVPLRALNPSAGGITRERGQCFNYQRWQVLPTFHPSYLLRNSAALGACWTDFRQAFAMAYPGSAS